MTSTTDAVTVVTPRADAVAAIAAEVAASVDRDARFPHEAVDALREQRLLSCGVATELGGDGLTLRQTAAVARTLGRACASTGMVFAMHQSQLWALERHGSSALVERAVAEQSLFASATTEIGIGGDTRSSSCAVAYDGDTVVLEKNAPVISYGEYADAVFVTARRSAEAVAGDQVLVFCPRDGVTLSPTSTWDTFGMRGTCSPGFMLEARTDAANVLPVPYADISVRTVVPVSHVLWSSVWLGIADAALLKARAYVRSAARKKPGQTPPGAVRLAAASIKHQQFADTVASAADRYDRAELASLDVDHDDRTSVAFALAMNNLKVSSSELVVEIVNEALLICGISGYREDSEYTLGRQLRDAHGAAVMVNNDRIMGNSAQMTVALRGEL